MTKILFWPDSHAKKSVSNDRFEWLGKLVVEERPEVIVNLGDLADMPSLSLYDVGKKSFEGRSYRSDIEAVWDAQERFFAPIAELNKSLRAAKKKMYQPEQHMVLGNHDHRILRAVEMDSKLDGTIGIDDLRYEDYGWKVHKFKDMVDIYGIWTTHHYTSGLMDRPIGGENIGNSILKKIHDNAIQGHCHTYNIAFSTHPSGRRIMAGTVGCYFEHKEDYVSPRAQADWARGVMILSVHNKEVQDFEWVSLNTLKREYGRK